MTFLFIPVFIGFIISTVLYGTTCGQVICYYRRYSSDVLGMTSLVVFVWLMDTVQQFLMTDTIWYYLIYRCGGDTSSFSTANWAVIFHVIPTEIAVVIVQCVFVRRIWIMSERNKWTYLFSLPIIAGTVADGAYIWKCHRFPSFHDDSKLQWIPITAAACRALTDIGIAVAMCTILRMKSGDMWKGSFVPVLADFALATGLVTSVATAGYLTALIAKPSELYYIGIYYVYGRLHVNTLLAGLNARDVLRNMAKESLRQSTPRPKWPVMFAGPSAA
ncbi:hypothetical protein OE88DRAFT_1662416 [Heliocybe sulcata]|uniref:DUF6534 domain-containing protein n=1 Tax=Heliocybe sulcata TaxID=5364 RepID=A0A5C3MWS7_9AGAM|nr:hypothetical protein OE88DRAFT_1662416 [Heliocybe sulcata]